MNRTSLLTRVGLLLLIFGSAGCAQSSRDGSFNGKTFTDSHFHIAFDLPPNLQPKAATQVNLHAKENADGYMMAAAQQGSEPYGIIVIAQRIQPEPGKIKTPTQFLNAVVHSRAASDVLGTRGHSTNASGLVFDWLDWTVPGKEFDAAVLTQRGDYFIVARCNAKSAADLESMKAALMAMRITR